MKLAEPQAGAAPPAPPPAEAMDRAVAEGAPISAPAAEPAPPSTTAPVAAAGVNAPSGMGAQPTIGSGPSVSIAPTREMLDIEASVSMQVPKVKHAVQALHELTARVGGVITNERVDTASEYGAAELTLRVPSGATQGVFEELDKLGSVLEQNVTARDIGKEYFDASLRLSSLEATQRRYQEILTHATTVEEILRIEAELGRIRGEIEQVKGNLRWLSDRAARATLHLTLRERVPEIAHSYEAEPKFFPGLRLPAMVDFGKHETQTYFGGGFSLRFTRAISLDLDVLKRQDSQTRGPDAVLASVGGEIYSDLLGGGERRFLNPYLGWRAGYARFDSDNQAMLGATLGLELYKNRWFGLDAEARNYLAFGGDRGAHYLLSPALAARIAF
jgi:Domain of unknown function (DUF4349)